MQDQINFYKNKLHLEIDPADLNEILNNQWDVVVIDTRKLIAFEKEHIPGAISFPHGSMNEESTKTLDKLKLYVTYCDGIGCNASTRGALKLTQFGFKVKELIGGIEWWKMDGFAVNGKDENGKQIGCNC